MVQKTFTNKDNLIISFYQNSGGRILTIRGNYLNVVQTPRIIVEVAGNTFSQVLNVQKCTMYTNGIVKRKLYDHLRPESLQD